MDVKSGLTMVEYARSTNTQGTEHNNDRVLVNRLKKEILVSIELLVAENSVDSLGSLVQLAAENSVDSLGSLVQISNKKEREGRLVYDICQRG